METKADLIKKYQEKYQLTEEEAKQLIADDEAVDKMTVSQINKEMTKEERKVMKAMCSASSGKKAPSKREKKANTAKSDLLNLLIAGLGESATEVNITNGEREFTFKSGETTYKVVMSVPRT